MERRGGGRRLRSSERRRSRPSNLIRRRPSCHLLFLLVLYSTDAHGNDRLAERKKGKEQARHSLRVENGSQLCLKDTPAAVPPLLLESPALL